MTDVDLLKDKIDESGMKVKAIAEKSGILRKTLYNKMNGKGQFTASEIVALSNVLRLTKKERDQIFLGEG